MIVIQGGTVLTVDAADTVHFPGHVVIDGDRITAVGAGGYAGEVTAGTEIIDASGMVVMPGLVDLTTTRRSARVSVITCRCWSRWSSSGTRRSGRSTRRPRTGPRSTATPSRSNAA